MQAVTPAPLDRRYHIRRCHDGADMAAARALRRLCFGPMGAQEGDPVDAACLHYLIRCGVTGNALCTFRLMLLDAPNLHQSYSAQSYDLTRLEGFAGRMLELGRFCVHPGRGDPDILRLAWGAMTRLVDLHDVRLLFGCSSFPGVDAAQYRAAFALLAARHGAPAQWAPCIGAPEVVRFADMADDGLDPAAAGRVMPPLLKTYLAMGGWVSDHAVIDRDMNTLHVFTGLEIAAIPAARKRALRALVPLCDGNTDADD